MLSNFISQKNRVHILENMINNLSGNIKPEDIYNYIMHDNNVTITDNYRRQGWIFESLCEILIYTRCIPEIDYTTILEGQLQKLQSVNNIKTLLNIDVQGGGNNISDITLKLNETIISFSIKYKGKFCETDVSKIDNTLKDTSYSNDYKIGLIVKDKNIIINHKYKNDNNVNKILHDKIIENNLLFDENDIIKGMKIFFERYCKNNTLTVNEFIEMINETCLQCPRKSLVLKLHQKLTVMRFNKNISEMYHCISHKPRSGKSITILSICKNLLENTTKNKILIMTSVPQTIDSFTDDLDTYIEFSDIRYIIQKEFDTVDNNFKGIVFCSVQYLKNDENKTKQQILKEIGFDVIFIDESHMGSSTDKTRDEILTISNKQSQVIFASGTSQKTQNFYRIPKKCIYEWDIDDENTMKNIKRKESIDIMIKKHGIIYTECIQDISLNHDYSKCPIQILIKHSINNKLIEEINTFNNENNTEYGYSCSSLFALVQDVDKDKNIFYREQFQLCNTVDGRNILIKFLQNIISNKPMDNTIMKRIEKIQNNYKSRVSTKENPLLIIVYLPVNTRNNTINSLQKTLKQFIEDNKLWSDYNIEYSNSTDDTNNIDEEYNNFIKTICNKAKNDNKKGTILLLGNKESVGITYHKCDITISLDDSHNISQQKQRFYRALTEAPGKTIGINVDMNIQRTYSYLLDTINKIRKFRNDNISNSQLFKYLFENQLFLFNPDELNYGRFKETEIDKYFDNIAKYIIEEVNDSTILENIKCDDDMKSFITHEFQMNKLRVSKELEGEQQECPKGGKDIIELDERISNLSINEKDEVIYDSIEDDINKTHELCKSLFPIMAIISRNSYIKDFKEILKFNEELITDILKSKIDFKNNFLYSIFKSIMTVIIDDNEEIINNIKEIYKTCSSAKVRNIIEKHFTPTNEEKKKYAEVATPVFSVDEMLSKIPTDFWETPKKVFEPCCGKGNFVLGIFDKFYNGLEYITDEAERCRIIVEECIYYADISPLNIFITSELLKCHIKSYVGESSEIDNIDFKSHTGDTLTLDVNSYWNIEEGFDTVIGNTPYNAFGNTGTGNTIWQDFTKISLNKFIKNNGYLLYVHPPGWRKPNTEKGKFYGLYKLMTQENQMLYLSIHGIKDGKQTFNCGTRYDWYIIQHKSKYTTTIVNDENNNKIVIDMNKFHWLPNYNIDTIQNILAEENEEKCIIIFDRTNYEPRKKWMSKIKTDEFKYPCIHSTPKKGIRYMYSSVNNKGLFGVSKVIFGESGIYNSVIDIDGMYGMTHGAMAIKVCNLEEATFIKEAIESEKFNKLIKSCMYSSFRIEWNLFKYFKKDFWKEFIDEE